METLIGDTRHGLRRLQKAPAFTTTTVLMFALGIGATTSIFTLVHAVMLKSLTVANPSELYRLEKETHCCDYGGYSQYHGFSIVSYDLYKHFRDNTKGLPSWQPSKPTRLFWESGVRVARSYPKVTGVNSYLAIISPCLA